MKFLTFTFRQSSYAGVLSSDQVFPLPWRDVREAIMAGLPAVQEALVSAKAMNYRDVCLKAPIPRPGKIVAVGRNYLDHCLEQNIAPPERPTIFTKFTTSVISPGDEISWNPALTQEVDYEGELAVVIGKHARHVRKQDAYDYILGFTCLNDVTARDLQRSDGQWIRAKSLDTFCPMGPLVVTVDELHQPDSLAVRTWVNGELRQDSNTRYLIHDVSALIAYCSAAFSLLPGDVIATGTPGGVGVYQNPPTFLKPGDQISIEIEGVGTLHNSVGSFQ